MSAHQASVLGAHKQNLDSFTERLLAPYFQRLQYERPVQSPKEFNDPLWGTIVLYPLELVFVDSPLLQRLRRIRQLGVAHWVYPGATHTRLEHSLGVVHQIQSLAAAINARHQGPGSPLLSPAITKLLRLSALLHDVGHGVMSHVSENALSTDESCEEIRLEFARKLDIESISLSEIASYYILGSPSFRSLLIKAIALTAESDFKSDQLGSIRRAVVGLPISDEIPLLHELISGPFDADKLDYMPRDAHMCGVPVVTDIPRLIQKVRAVTVAQSDLPPEVARNCNPLPSYTMTGVAFSGGRTLDELMLGRTLLFDKIYRHQKSRAIEAMVASILEEVGPSVAESRAMVPYVFTDDELVDLTYDSLRAKCLYTPTPEDTRRFRVAADIAERLRQRNLFVRAFAYAQNMPLDPYAIESKQRTGLERFIRETQNISVRNKIRGRIATQIRAILKKLKLSSRLPLDHRLLSYIAIDPPRTSPEVSQIARAYLVSSDGTIKRFRDDYAESKGWADAYLLTRDIGFVFASSEISQIGYIATERILREEYGVRMPRSMLTSYAKQDEGRISSLKRRLINRGYYSGLSYDLRPLPSRLLRADVQRRIEEVVRTLSGYNGPVTQNTKTPLLNAARIVDWLRQFERDDFIDCGLKLLEKVVLFGRDTINSALSSFIGANPEYKNGIVCRLGTQKDSSSVIVYFAQDVAPTLGLKSDDLVNALSVQSAPIIFVDDFVGTGSQAISIIENWLKAPRSVPLSEDHGPALSTDLRRVFRGRELGFVFGAGTNVGANALRARLVQLGLSGKVHIQIDSGTLPRAFGRGLYASADKELAFKKRCERIGKALLADKKTHHTARWIRDRSLGYGNDGLLVIFAYNTPTQALTCLWKRGKVGNVDWLPLFPRREKI